MHNTLERIHTRITEAEKQINILEDRMLEITATEQNMNIYSMNRYSKIYILYIIFYIFYEYIIYEYIYMYMYMYIFIEKNEKK